MAQSKRNLPPGAPRRVLWMALLAMLLPLSALGGTPRFITGQGWSTWPGKPVVWGQTTLLYFTDPGPLSATVSHAQADAMVAAAAASWNVPTSSISYAQGGVLAEDVSSTNTYFDGTSYVFPVDATAANEDNIPVAIVYDEDGSLIDLLLGAGASDPDSCRENAVVGDVDDIHTADSQIHHALLLLNGRCVGSAPEQMLEMQYLLERALGRVLGLSWSQTNDNVFTAQTTVTASQMTFWPVMHPMDVICGNYTYQCMLDPFVLRPDDLNTLAQLYLVAGGAVPTGKQATSDGALFLRGTMYFPTGQGMDWVNVTTRLENAGYSEDWQTTSVMTGSSFLEALPTPVNTTAASSAGSGDPSLEGFFTARRVPLYGSSNVYFTTEPVNPLYTGDYAIGPYVRPPATPSGSPTGLVDWSALPAGDWPVIGSFTATDAAASCNPGADGMETAPATPDASGFQTGQLCSWGHNSWWTVSAAAGHAWTIEVTATDETGASSTGKAQPVIGVWGAGDATGTLPTVASQAAPFNSMVMGMTQLLVPGVSAGAGGGFRFSISDQFGAGRPDFTYAARVLYAASSAPATVGVSGGQIVVTGTGFREGNQVFVNGVPAEVTSWTATQIVATVPDLGTAAAQLGVPLEVDVFDPETGGFASIPGAVTFAALPDQLRLVAAPAQLSTGIAAATSLTIQAWTNDGSAVVPNTPVQLAVLSGSAQLAACGAAAACTVLSDVHGTVSTSVTGLAAGEIVLVATEQSGGASVQVTATDTDPARAMGVTTPDVYVAEGSGGSWAVQAKATSNGAGAAATTVSWTPGPGLSLPVQEGTTAQDGTVSAVVLASATTAAGDLPVTVCAWTSVCGRWQLHVVDGSDWMLQTVSGGTQMVTVTASLQPVILEVTDRDGHPLEGAPVQVHQRVLGWEGSCSAQQGRCPAAPVLLTGVTTLMSDANGLVSVTPLEVAGVPQTVELAASSGSQGLVTLTLSNQP